MGDDRIPFSIYIVDDEPMAISYFEYLLKAIDADCEIVGKASNGASALPEILRLCPDMVFADISMPVMDGLRMAEKVLEKNPSQKIILLTSYKDFEYVHQGMKIGVKDYLLKNEITEESLKRLLDEEFCDLQKERRERHLITEHNVRAFLLGSDAEEGGYDHIYEDRPLQRYCLLSIVPRPLIRMGKPAETESGVFNTYQVERFSFPEGISCRVFVKMGLQEYCGIFFIQENAQDVERKLRSAAMQILDYLGSGDNVCMFSPLTGKFLDLRLQYQELKALQEYVYRYEDERILEAARMKEDQRQPERENWNFRIFGEALRREDKAETLRIMNKFFSEWRSCRQWEYADYVKRLWRVINDFAVEKKIRPSVSGIRDFYSSPGELERDLCESLEHIFLEIEEQKENQYSKHILLAREYIYQNYQRDISLADIAQAAGISEGHLRRCFRQELKTTVIAYLTDCRLECVKQLMRAGESNLDQIWKKTGFSSPQYFSYVFKKNEGMAPREYMKKINTKDGE